MVKVIDFKYASIHSSMHSMPQAIHGFHAFIRLLMHACSNSSLLLTRACSLGSKEGVVPHVLQARCCVGACG